MKKQFAISALCVVAWALPAYSGVTILSEEYTIKWYEWSDEKETYDGEVQEITSELPFSVSSDGARASAGNFSVDAGTDYSQGWGISASSTYIFTIDQPLLTIDLEGELWSCAFPDIDGHISYSLYDQATGTNIDGQSWSLSDADLNINPYGWERSIDETMGFILAIDHEYGLQLSARVTSADGTTASLGIELTATQSLPATVIPAPGALLLGGIGVGCVSWLRRRRAL